MRYLKLLNKSLLPIFITGIYLFLYIPITVLVIYSFNSAEFPAPWQSFSLEWYHQLFHSSAIWQAFFNSIIIAVSATFLSCSMALGLMYYHMMGGGKTGSLVSLFYGNIIIPEIVLAVGLLSFLTFISVPLGIPTLIVAHTVLGLGYVIPLVYARFLLLDYRLLEASLDLGATRTQTFYRVVMPALLPTLAGAALLIFIISFDDFVLSFFVAGGESQTLSLYIYSMIRSGVTPVVNALSAILLILSALFIFVFTWLNRRTTLF